MDVPTDEAHPPESVQFGVQSDAATPRVVSMSGSGGITPENTETGADFLSQQATDAANLFFADEELNALPVAAEPEWLDIECCLGTGSSVHAVNRLGIPGCEITESPGSRAGQQFHAAGGSLIDNEGQAILMLVPPDEDTKNPVNICMQVAKVTRPLISVPKLTEGDRLAVICKENEALVQTPSGQTVARFKKKAGLYVCLMRIKNPKWAPFMRPA